MNSRFFLAVMATTFLTTGLAQTLKHTEFGVPWSETITPEDLSNPPDVPPEAAGSIQLTLRLTAELPPVAMYIAPSAGPTSRPCGSWSPLMIVAERVTPPVASSSTT